MNRADNCMRHTLPLNPPDHEHLRSEERKGVHCREKVLSAHKSVQVRLQYSDCPYLRSRQMDNCPANPLPPGVGCVTMPHCDGQAY